MKYVKLPARTYNSGEVRKYQELANHEDEFRREEKDMIVLNHLKDYICVALNRLEGCTFTPTSYIDDEEFAFEKKAMSATLITFADGESLTTSWSVKEFVKNMISWNLIDSSFLEEVK